MSKNSQPFAWRPLHDKCFEMIKYICCKTPVLVPVNHDKDDPIWVICDASVSGVGAMYSQGPTWQTCRPAGFMSHKFTDAQRHYRVFEQETIAILEALLKWEDKLIGYCIHVVTNHQALEFFKTQDRLLSRQTRWMEYLTRFDFDIHYIKGKLNKVADCLSRYYESDTWYDVYNVSEYVDADVRLNPTLDDVPWNRLQEIKDRTIEMHAIWVTKEARQRKSNRLAERQEEHDVRAAELAAAPEPTTEAPVAVAATEEDPTVFASRVCGEHLVAKLTANNSFITDIKSGYDHDSLFAKVLKQPDQHAAFTIRDQLIWSRNRGGEQVLCVPSTKMGHQSLHGVIIDQAHTIVGHFGPQRTVDYIRRWYWWPRIQREVQKFCNSCQVCLKAKEDARPPARAIALLADTHPTMAVNQHGLYRSIS
jgi:hypothetical protein